MGPAIDQRTRARRSSPSSPPPAAAWSPVAFTRPSNLYSFVRAGASFPPTSEPRSQRTQATQTRNLQTASDGARDVDLGAFGRVGDLPLDTVDFLLRVLEDRKHELLAPPARAPAELHAPRSRSDDQRRVGRWRSSSRAASKSRAVDDEHTESSDASDEPAAAATVPRDDAQQAPLAPAAIVRSRSYEALVQLEGILEARHQQLMRDGVLEPPASAPFAGGGAATSYRPGGGRYGEDKYDDERDEDAGGLEMADIQEEIREMHRSLRRRRRAEQSANVLDGALE